MIRWLGKQDTGLQSVTMTVTVFRNFLREALFRLGRRVEIYETSGRGLPKLVKQASPGNLQDVEEDLGGHIESAPVILAVKITAKATEARSVGVCFADASTRELGVSEFLDNDVYSNFGALLIQLGVKEVLLLQDSTGKDVEITKLKKVALDCNIVTTERSASDFSTKDVEQDLRRLLRDETALGTTPQIESKLTMGAASALIKNLNLMSDPTNEGQYKLIPHDLEQYMKLDAAALRALNLMPGPRDGAKSMSLYGLLNHCRTPLGGRLLSQWLKQPLMNLEMILRRQNLVAAFYDNTGLRQAMQDEYLRSVPDIFRLAKKFQRGRANLEDVVRAYQVVIRLPEFILALQDVIDEKQRAVLDSQYTIPMVECHDKFGGLQEMVEKTIDLEALDRHEYIIRADFDDNLKIIKTKLNQVRKDLDMQLHLVAEDLHQEKDKKLFLEQHRVHGWCFRLTRAESSCIRAKSKYSEVSTMKNGVYFTTTDLISLRRQHDDLSNSYNRQQGGLVSEIVAVAASYCPVLEKLGGLLADLDVIVSLAHVASHSRGGYVRPKMCARGTGNTNLIASRHPCMEVQDDIDFIANDVKLERGTSEFLIITGPNMGGKSTYIRQIGVIALMAQVGSFVPCSSAELCIYDCILARVGASDSQLKGVSTFMAEMLETASIIKTASRDSLIVIDELGRGTSTYDGFGLAWAIAEHIVKEIRCQALFATHFHELTALAKEHAEVKNLHVTSLVSDTRSNSTQNNDSNDIEMQDVNTTSTTTTTEVRPPRSNRNVTLLYSVREGICDQSFGIHVAEVVSFPQKVINMAKLKAEQLEDFSTSTNTSTNTNSTTGKHDQIPASQGDAFSKEEIQIGSQLLKNLLKRWKLETEGMAKSEQIVIMKKMVEEDEALRENGYFQRQMAAL